MEQDVKGAEALQMSRKHIFCVNGSPEFLNILREVFQDEQYNVTTTNYVPETAALIDTLQPDLIIVDLVIGIEAGWDLLERMNADASMRGIPVIVTSTDKRQLEEVAEHPERYGADAHLVKPLDLDVLVATAVRLIGPA